MRPDVAVVITGMGVVTPAGNTIDDFWQSLVAGRSTAAPLDRFDTARHPVRFGCQVTEPARGDGPSGKDLRRMDPFTRFAVIAAVAARRDAGSPAADPSRTAVVVGNAVGGRTTSDAESGNFHARGPAGVNPLMPLATMPNAAAASIAMHLGCTGPAHTIATTCASGADALGHAMAMLRADTADVVVAGGCEATLTPVTLAAFANLGALSTRNDDPAAASRPFDGARDGFVMGEGAAFVVLEREQDALARGAEVLGRILGYAATSDAHHLSQPHPSGAGAVSAMRGALRNADLAPRDIGHVNAHGTSTRLNDQVEADALNEVFGASAPAVTATKGVTGHLLGASGTAEAIATVLALRSGCVPPVANHESTDVGVHLDVVHGAPRPLAPGPALSNSFGFGGHNASLVVAS